VKPGGYLIIEDIPERALPIWQLVIGQPGLDLKFEMFKGYHSYVLVIKKKK
jgi:hypothetical protein